MPAVIYRSRLTDIVQFAADYVKKLVLFKCRLLIAFGNSFDPDQTGPRSAVGNVSGYRCVSDCRSRGREFDPGPVPYFRGD